jgi:transcriptional regulator with PAS, ATPase and Fis domain
VARREAIVRARTVACVDGIVPIAGESGTGKESIAQDIND